MDGDTTFHFITGGIHDALEQATAAAGGADIRLGGGVGTIRQYLDAGLLDELHIAIAPALLGRGEQLRTDLDLPTLGYRITEHAATPNATHILVSRT